MSRLRFGCHDFLNSKPITYAITQGLVDAPFDMVFAPPAQLADKLAEGSVDFAFIPAIEYARIPDIKIVPNFSISAFGEVKTVILVTEQRLWDVQKIAADTRSRTSVALLKIMFAEFYRNDVRIVKAHKKDPMLSYEKYDGVMIIGDDAFNIDRRDYRVTDLSDAWHGFTGKPMVFALLCVRDGIDLTDVIPVLEEARQKGLESLDAICRKAEEEQGILKEQCQDYLHARIKYELGRDEIEGLQHFIFLASEHGIIDKDKELKFYGQRVAPAGRPSDS